MRERQRPGMGLGPPMGPATKWLMGLIVGATVLFFLTERAFGIGIKDLIFTVDGILSLELWRLVTFPFVEYDPLSLVISLVVLYFFGRFFETQWGSGAYARFYLASSVGAAIIAVPLGFVINLVAPFNEIGVAAGPDAAIDAMLVAMALMAPDSHVLFGFILPMRARTVVLAVLGMQVVFGIMSGAAALGVTLGGMAMGYVLVTGIWRPERLLARLRVWRLRKRRKGIYVVPPGGDETLH